MLVEETAKYKIDQVGNNFKAYISSRGNWVFLGRYTSMAGARAKIDSWLNKEQ